jgi:hypothetical protein
VRVQQLLLLDGEVETEADEGVSSGLCEGAWNKVTGRDGVPTVGKLFVVPALGSASAGFG